MSKVLPAGAQRRDVMTEERVIAALLALTLCGCSAKGIYQGVYEGARVRSELQATPAERVGRQELPTDYQRYDSMRSEKK
jgi:hypothetical protein